MASTYARANRHTLKRLPYTADLLPADQALTLQELVNTLPPEPSTDVSKTLNDTLYVAEHGWYEPSPADISTAVAVLGCLLARKFASSGVAGLRACVSQHDHEVLCQAAAIGHS